MNLVAFIVIEREAIPGKELRLVLDAGESKLTLNVADLPAVICHVKFRLQAR